MGRILTRQQPDRDDIRFLICDDEPEIIEDYDPRSTDGYRRGCLILGKIGGRGAHVHCAYPPSGVIVTAYWPDIEPDEWTDDYERRVPRT